jgi:hypothetical protein
MMAIKRISYFPADFDFLMIFIRWYQNSLNLRDWEISLEFGDDLPCWSNVEDENDVEGILGLCLPDFFNLRAKIWINQIGCERDDCHPLMVLAHELTHTLFSFIENISFREQDILCHKLEYLMVNQFCKEKGIELLCEKIEDE